MSSFETVIFTADGSHTVRVPGKNEQYHSLNGALTESEHVFIQAGFDFVMKGKTELNILEVGFGTGLNALLTYVHAAKSGTTIRYTAVEPYPLDADTITHLNYPVLKEFSSAPDVFFKMHRAMFNRDSMIRETFWLHKITERIEECRLPQSYFDLVFFDAFSPAVQPELWSLQVFDGIANATKPGAVLVTYCCKGDVKRTLMAAGFVVQKILGPPGKREMIRAVRH